MSPEKMFSGDFFDYILSGNDNVIGQNYKNMEAADHGEMRRFCV